MKRSRAIFVLLMLIILSQLVSCSPKKAPSFDEDSGHEGEISDKLRWFDAEVISVHEGSVFVRPIGDTSEAQSMGESGVSVSCRLSDKSTAPKMSVGDIIRITYSGEIATSYPPQIFNVYSIYVK